MPRSLDGDRTVTVRAFAPGHLTAVFRPELSARDPRARGSVGAGITLELGAWARARWTPNAPRRVTLRSEQAVELAISTEVAHRLAAGSRGRIEVRLHHDLPIGQGFGMSAAGALATALAVGGALGVPRQRAVETAHLADLFGGGGLGGVAAILHGGLELRSVAGIPPWGEVQHSPSRQVLYVAVAGAPTPSPRLLRSPGFLAKVRVACGDAVRRLERHFGLERLLVEAERFTDRLSIGPAKAVRAIERLRSPRVRVAQAMLGRALYAVPCDAPGERRLRAQLERLGLSAIRIRPSAGGAITLRRR